MTVGAAGKAPRQAGDSGFLGGRLGQFVANAPSELFGARLRHEGKRCILNHVGCSLAARREKDVERVVRVMGQLSHSGAISVIGRRERGDVPNAAFVNAMTANYFDFDDTHDSTVIHPTAPVLAAALAVGELERVSGAALLESLILGIEVACRIGKAVSPMHYARGWHITSTCGVFGAAAATARLLGLDARKVWMALGIAASQSAGNIENLTYFPKNASVGNAARNGVMAAYLAREGCEAAPAAIEGRFGWARTMGDRISVEQAADGLGTDWELFNNTYKPYPTGVVFHAAIDASLKLRDRIAQPLAVTEIVLAGHQLLSDRGDRIVFTPGDARVSAQHCIAATLVRGRCTLAEYDENAVADPDIAALRSKVRIEVDRQVPLGAAVLRVLLGDGSIDEVRQDNALGSLARPLGDHDLRQKFLQNCQFGGWEPTNLVGQIWDIDRFDDITPVLHACRSDA